MAATAAKNDAKAKTRGDGPVIVTFVDDKGKADYRRVPENVVAIQVDNRNGVTKQFPLSTIKPEMQFRFFAHSYANRLKSWVATNSEKPDDVIGLADELADDFINGNMYSRAEGGERAGRKFEPTIYLQAVTLAYAEMAKKGIVNKKTGQSFQPLTEAGLKDLETKLVAMPTKERTEKLKSMLEGNPFYKKHLGILKLAALKAKQIDASDTSDFDVL